MNLRFLRFLWRQQWNYVSRDGTKIAVQSQRGSHLAAGFWSVFGLCLLLLAIPFAIQSTTNFMASAAKAIDSAVSYSPNQSQATENGAAPLTPHTTNDARVDHAANAFSHVLLCIFWYSVAYTGVSCIRRARKNIANSPQSVLQSSQDGLVIYLRSFEQDSKALTNAGLPAQARASTTLEERIVRHLRTIGPAVAIGRPHENLPPIGAARLYVDDADWQNVVSDLLHRAAFVLLQAGCTPGIQWELAAAMKVLKPEQLLIFLPGQLTAGQRKREEAYVAFCNWASSHLPIALPHAIGSAAFLGFLNTPAWQPVPLSRNDLPANEQSLHLAVRQLVCDRRFRPPLVGHTGIIIITLLLGVALAFAIAIFT